MFCWDFYLYDNKTDTIKVEFYTRSVRIKVDDDAVRRCVYLIPTTTSKSINHLTKNQKAQLTFIIIIGLSHSVTASQSHIVPWSGSVMSGLRARGAGRDNYTEDLLLNNGRTVASCSPVLTCPNLPSKRFYTLHGYLLRWYFTTYYSDQRARKVINCRLVLTWDWCIKDPSCWRVTCIFHVLPGFYLPVLIHCTTMINVLVSLSVKEGGTRHQTSLSYTYTDPTKD